MKRIAAVFFLALIGMFTGGMAGQAPQYDILLEGGRVLDGSGNPWFRADVAVNDGRIAAVGNIEASSARKVIDVTGKYISPGFIDIHSHADGELYKDRGLRADDRARRTAPNLVSQGITTVVVNQDGRSLMDLSVAGQLEEFREKGIGVNAAALVGHNTIRRQVLGEDNRRLASDEEVKEMREKVRRAMEAGAFGLSAGLEYVPGRWSDTEEVIELVKEIVPYGGVYISHQRSEGKSPMGWLPSDEEQNPPTLLDAVSETIRIGEVTGAVVVSSHLKARGAHYRGGSHAAIAQIRQARQRGVRIYGDQYPYNTSGSDGSTVLIPGWAYDRDNDQDESNDNGENYAKRLGAVLEDPGREEKLIRDIKYTMQYRGGADNIVVFEYPDSSYIGRNLGELARERNMSPARLAIRLQMEGFTERRGGARLRSFSMFEEDIKAYASQPWVATVTDGGVTLPEDGNNVHARFYGTFPRKISKYALEEQAITLEHAVRSSTSLPAQVLGMKNRGRIIEGYWADIVVFDLQDINDEATFFDPHQHSSGIEYVFVNGRAAVERGKLTGILSGVPVTPRDAQQLPERSINLNE